MDSAEYLAKLTTSAMDMSKVRNDNPFGNHSNIEIAFALSGLDSTSTGLVYYLWMGEEDKEESLLRGLLVESVQVAHRNKWSWKLVGKAEHLRSLVYAELKGLKRGSSCEPCNGVGHVLDKEGDKVMKCVRCLGVGRSATTVETKSKWYASTRIELTNPNVECMDKYYLKYTSEYKKWIKEGKDISSMIIKIDMDARNHIRRRL